MTPEQKAATAKGGKEFVAHLEEGEGFDPEFQSVNEALMPEDTVVTTTHAEHLVLETSEELVDTRQRLERRAFGDREAKRMPDEVPTIVSERPPSIVSERPRRSAVKRNKPLDSIRETLNSIRETPKVWSMVEQSFCFSPVSTAVTEDESIKRGG